MMLAFLRSRFCPLIAVFSLTAWLAPAPAALVAHWPLDVSGTDATANNYHLTLRNGAAVRTTAGEFIIGTGAMGGQGAAGHLDGTDDGAVADGLPSGTAFKGIGGTGARTVALWVRAVAPGGTPVPDPFPTLVSWGSGGSPNGGRFDVRLNEAAASLGRIRAEVNGGGNNAGAPAVNDGGWHHVLVTMTEGAANLSGIQIHVDGKRITAAPQNNPTIFTGDTWPLTLGDSVVSDESILNGNTTNINRNLRGWLDDVAVFDDAAAGQPAVDAAASAAILHGFGKLAGLGLTILPAAQSLWINGGSASIGGRTWFKATSLTGGAGDTGGSLAGNDAYITLDAAGNGLALFASGSPDFIGYPPQSSYIFQVGQTVSLTADKRGQNPTSFTVAPALPGGLSLNTTSGNITGSFTVSSAPRDYTITATYPSLPPIARILRLEARSGIYEPFEDRTGPLDADPAWATQLFGTAGEDYVFEATGGNPGQRLDAPAGPESAVTLTSPAWTTGQDFLLSTDVLANANTTWGGLLFGGTSITPRVDGAALYYQFHFSNGSATPGNANVIFSSFNGTTFPEELASGAGLGIVLNRWYRLTVAHTALDGNFNLRLTDPATRAVLWQRNVVNRHHSTGSFGLNTELGGPIKFDNFSVTTGQVLAPYSAPQAVYPTGVPIMPNTTRILNGPATQLSISPALPIGLAFDPTTGSISGAPAAAFPLTTFTVTATFANGGTSATSVELSAVVSSFSGYPLPATPRALVGAQEGVVIPDLVPITFGRPPALFSITPSLPAGLVLDPATGIISGTPTARSPFTTHTVTASWTTGEPSNQVVILTEVINVNGGFADNFEFKIGNLDDDALWSTLVFGTTNGTDFVFEPTADGVGTQLDPPGGLGVIAVVPDFNLEAGRSFQFWTDFRFKADTEWGGLIFGYQTTTGDHFAVQWSDGKEAPDDQVLRAGPVSSGVLTPILSTALPLLQRNRFYRCALSYQSSSGSLLIRLFDLVDGVQVAAQTVAAAPTLSGLFGLRTDRGNTTAFDNFAIDLLPEIIPPLGFAITSVSRSAGSVTVTWNSAVGGQYRVQRSTATSGWTNLTAGTAGTGAIMSYTDSTAGSAPRLFYRVAWDP